MQTSIYVPDWLMTRVPTPMPRGLLSTLLQEVLLDRFPDPKATERDQIEERMIRLKVKSLLGEGR